MLENKYVIFQRRYSQYLQINFYFAFTLQR